MQLRLHNTLTRKKEPFAPLDPARVRMYVCGPTVYQRIHVGNARPFVVFDVLFRLLRHLYGADHVVYVRNITDIDDKIINQARKNGEDIQALTERTAREFHADVAALGCLPPTHEPRATEHIGDMIRLIEALIARGHAYAAEGHVLFHVPSMPAYGRLSGRSHEEQIAGARVEVAPYKRDPADFVLWKPSDPEQPGWDSPWGRGRPGWHIECSAMSERWLGVPFDIHAGGLDLIFPHHENEIAQSCCAHALDVMARYWLHNGFLDMHGEKMSKSLGNVVRIPEALAVAPGEAVRLLLLGTHYRQPADFTEEVLVEAEHRRKALYSALGRAREIPDAKPDDKVVAALMDDLNTPLACNLLQRIARRIGSMSDIAEQNYTAGVLTASAWLLGLLNDKEERKHHRRHRAGSSLSEAVGSATVSGYAIQRNMPEEQIERALAVRAQARRDKRFADADRIRAQLEGVGILIEDTPTGTVWRRV